MLMMQRATQMLTIMTAGELAKLTGSEKQAHMILFKLNEIVFEVEGACSEQPSTVETRDSPRHLDTAVTTDQDKTSANQEKESSGATDLPSPELCHSPDLKRTSSIQGV